MRVILTRILALAIVLAVGCGCIVLYQWCTVRNRPTDPAIELTASWISPAEPYQVQLVEVLGDEPSGLKNLAVLRVRIKGLCLACQKIPNGTGRLKFPNGAVLLFDADIPATGHASTSTDVLKLYIDFDDKTPGGVKTVEAFKAILPITAGVYIKNTIPPS